jgi:hypothetical protein
MHFLSQAIWDGEQWLELEDRKPSTVDDKEVALATYKLEGALTTELEEKSEKPMPIILGKFATTSQIAVQRILTL